MASRVEIDNNRITRVNGRPFFPITAQHVPAFGPEQLRRPWHATAAQYAALHDIGFNAVRFVPFGGQAFTYSDYEVPMTSAACSSTPTSTTAPSCRGRRGASATSAG